MTRHSAVTFVITAAVAAGCLEDRKATDPDLGAPAGPDAAAGGASTDAALDTEAGPGDLGAGGAADTALPDAAPAASLLSLGAACVADAECDSGHCALPCQGYGTCAPRTCDADADCAVPDASGTFCCVEGACAAIAGDTCGDRQGRQGASCASGGGSDCTEGLACVDACGANAYCAAACEDDAACAAVGPGLACFRVVTGENRCVADPDRALWCDDAADCGRNQACVPYLDFAGTGVIKACVDEVGSRDVGATCNNDEQCGSGYCNEGRCTGGCGDDASCGCNGRDSCVDQICLDTWFSLDPEHFDAVKLCAPRTRCQSSADCPEAECVAWPEIGAFARVCDAPAAAAKAAGEACEDASDCRSGACFEGFCRSLCGADAHCAEGQTCRESTLNDPFGTPATLELCREEAR